MRQDIVNAQLVEWRAEHVVRRASGQDPCLPRHRNVELLEFGDSIEDSHPYSMAQRHMYPSMGALRRSLTADVAALPKCSARALHSTARRLEEQPSDASPAHRTPSRHSMALSSQC
jgi:hypothetical protein